MDAMPSPARAEPAHVAPPDASGAPTAAWPRAALAGFVAAWLLFWVLLVLLALQDDARAGRLDVGRRLLWEGTSFVVATGFAAWSWRRVARFDHRLGSPARWFAAHLWPLVAIAPAYVALVFGLRHGIYAAVGARYLHGPWLSVFAYEVPKFALFYLLWIAVVFGVRAHAALAAQRWRLERERALARQAQLVQLAQQIEPHFLFNALNTIAQVVHEDAERADALLVRLAALLRAATDLARQPVCTLGEEIDLLEGYLDIMRERHGARVRVTLEVDPAARGCRVPSLSLQPLVENAFRHGVERHPGTASVAVHATCRDDRLRITVVNVPGAVGDAPGREGVGLSNLRERLDAMFGAAATFALEPGATGGVCARVELPCTR